MGSSIELGAGLGGTKCLPSAFLMGVQLSHSACPPFLVQVQGLPRSHAGLEHGPQATMQPLFL